MISCPACHIPVFLPAPIAPNRFGALGPKVTDDDFSAWSEEVDKLLQYLRSVLISLPGAYDVSAETGQDLQYLALDLAKEARVRLQKLEEAAEIWKLRAQGKEAPSAVVGASRKVA